VVANTGSYGKCINSGLAIEAMNGFVRSIQGHLRGTGSASRRFQAAGRREFSLAGVGTLWSAGDKMLASGSRLNLVGVKVWAWGSPSKAILRAKLLL
jgi:hypothetical protein